MAKRRSGIDVTAAKKNGAREALQKRHDLGLLPNASEEKVRQAAKDRLANLKREAESSSPDLR